MSLLLRFESSTIYKPWCNKVYNTLYSGQKQAPKDTIKLFSCSTHMSMKFVIFINIQTQINEAIFLLWSVNNNFVQAINFKMPTIVGILKFMTRTNFMLIRVENNIFLLPLGADLHIMLPN